MFINNNVFGTESFLINFGIFLAYIESYSVDIHISAKHLFCFRTRKVLANTNTIIPPKSEALMLFKQISLSDSQDFFFHPVSQPKLIFYTYLIDHTTYKVLVRSNVNHYIQVPRNHKLGCVTKLAYKNYFVARIDINATAYLSLASPLFHKRNGITIPPADNNMKMELPHGIKIYGNSNVIQQIIQLVNKYLSIQEFLEFAHLFSKYWIKILLKSGWKSRVASIKPRVYPLGNNSKRLIDKTFDKMQCFGRFKFIDSHMSFSFLVFVVQKTISNGERKSCTVVDIKKLNKLVILDTYLLPLQSEIIANVQKCTNLTVLNVASFFYQ